VRSRWDGFRSVLAIEIDRYLAQKRALGRRFLNEARSLRLLDRFFVERAVKSAQDIDGELLEAFLASRPRTRPRSYNHLLAVIRGFFDWLRVQGVLPCSPLQSRPRRETARRIPFLFDARQARRLLEVAGSLPDRNGAPLRGASYRTIFALLYGLGLRVGEISRLRLKDVDSDRQLLVIRETKFSKTRLVPFGPRIGELLSEHLRLRASRSGPIGPETPLFCFRKGEPVSAGTISQTFHALVPRLGLEIRPGVAAPRVHDLRHSFAVGTLLRWYREGIDPTERLFHLSTFLGHVDPTSTAVYLTITADLLREANCRFERFAAPALPAEVAQ
jgi:site-specific recombinase XerD